MVHHLILRDILDLVTPGTSSMESPVDTVFTLTGRAAASFQKMKKKDFEKLFTLNCFSNKLHCIANEYQRNILHTFNVVFRFH